jgi:hypothetical protein
LGIGHRTVDKEQYQDGQQADAFQRSVFHSG